jgi:hypothetical protein
MKSILIAITVFASLVSINEATGATNQRSVCDACVADISNMHSHLTASNSLRDQMQLRTSVCGPMPAASQSLCEQAVGQIVPSLEIKLRNAPLACGDLGLCNKTEAVVAATLTAQNSNDLNCPLCEYLVAMVKEQLEDKDTETELLAKAAEICANLPGDAKTSCLQYVAQYGKELFKWIHEEDPDAVCAMAGLCDPSTHLMPLTPPLREAASSLLSAQNDEQCNTCQLVVVEAASALSDPESQKQILEYVKQSCQDFQAFADQCATYIELYGPLVLNMAKGYLTPALCEQLGFCPKPASDIIQITA